jgi:hypothetical protein
MRRGEAHRHEDARLDPRPDGRLGEREDRCSPGDLHASLPGGDTTVDVVERAATRRVILVGGQLLQRDQVVQDVDDRHADRLLPQASGIDRKSKAAPYLARARTGRKRWSEADHGGRRNRL